MKFLEQLFSVKNKDKHKILTICGLKLKFVNSKKILEDKFNNLQKDISQTQNILQDIIDDINIVKGDQLNNLEEMKTRFRNLSHLSINALRATTPQPNLRYFEVHLTEHCNLNCQGCMHFSSLAEEGFTSLDEFEKDFKRLSELTNKNVNVLSIMGGEPLLHPDCNKFLDIARVYFPYTKIQLVTNGILLSGQNEEFWQTMQRNNIILRPTKYPIKIDWEKIQNIADQYNVTLEFYNNTSVLKTSMKLPVVKEGTVDTVKSFLNCWVANNCIYLSKGKLYTCMAPGNIKHFNKHFGLNIPESENDGIDIYKAKDIKEILEFLAKPIPFCAYCDFCNMQYNIPWKVTGKDIKEWTL